MFGTYEKTNETINQKEYFQSIDKKYGLWFHGGYWIIGKAEDKGTDKSIFSNSRIGKPSFNKDICSKPLNVANGFCNDETNNEDCAWDGGDCCLNEVSDKYCEDCKCLDPKFKDTGSRQPRNDEPIGKTIIY